MKDFKDRSKNLNYFDTPEDRRKGKNAVANFMDKALNDKIKREKSLQNFVSSKDLKN